MVRSIQMIKTNFITMIMDHLSGMALLIIGIISIIVTENTRRVVIVGLMVKHSHSSFEIVCIE